MSVNSVSAVDYISHSFLCLCRSYIYIEANAIRVSLLGYNYRRQVFRLKTTPVFLRTDVCMDNILPDNITNATKDLCVG